MTNYINAVSFIDSLTRAFNDHQLIPEGVSLNHTAEPNQPIKLIINSPFYNKIIISFNSHFIPVDNIIKLTLLVKEELALAKIANQLSSDVPPGAIDELIHFAILEQ